MSEIVKVVKIIDADRQAGFSVVERPPKLLIGKIGMITRPLIQWDGYWVTFYFKNRKRICERKDVLSKDELVEATEEEIKKFNKLQIEFEEQYEAEMMAERL
jgi:hypothetical protein